LFVYYKHKIIITVLTSKPDASAFTLKEVRSNSLGVWERSNILIIRF